MLVPRYQRRVLRLAYTMLGNAALAEDTVQETLRVSGGLGEFRPQASLGT